MQTQGRTRDFFRVRPMAHIFFIPRLHLPVNGQMRPGFFILGTFSPEYLSPGYPRPRTALIYSGKIPGPVPLEN